MSALCAMPGCTDVGVFPGDGADVFCFVHDPNADQAPADTPAAPAVDDAGGFHIDVVNGLAAMLLEHAAMTLLDGDDPAGDAMRSLAANTGMTLDVAAGILLGASMIMVAGEVTADALMTLAETLEREADADASDDLDAGAGEPVRCDVCTKVDGHASWCTGELPPIADADLIVGDPDLAAITPNFDTVAIGHVLSWIYTHDDGLPEPAVDWLRDPENEPLVEVHGRAIAWAIARGDDIVRLLASIIDDDDRDPISDDLDADGVEVVGEHHAGTEGDGEPTDTGGAS